MIGHQIWADRLATCFKLSHRITCMQALLAWATLVDKYLKKVATEVKPELIIFLPTGDAALLPEWGQRSFEPEMLD